MRRPADPKTVLLVDDDAETRAMLGEILRLRGYRVAEAGDGQAAIRCLEGNPPPDAIVLDLHMPVMDGWGFLDWKTRQPPPISNVPVITISGTGEQPGMDLVVASVPKPVDVDRLVRCVEVHSRQEHRRAA